MKDKLLQARIWLLGLWLDLIKPLVIPSVYLTRGPNCLTRHYQSATTSLALLSIDRAIMHLKSMLKP